MTVPAAVAGRKTKGTYGKRSIVLIRRDGDLIYPRGHTWLQLGDRPTLMGEITAVRELVRQCES